MAKTKAPATPSAPGTPGAPGTPKPRKSPGTPKVSAPATPARSPANVKAGCGPLSSESSSSSSSPERRSQPRRRRRVSGVSAGSASPRAPTRAAPSTPARAAPATPVRAAPGTPVARASGAGGAEAKGKTTRYFRVEGHLHLGLNLTLRKVYSETDLTRRCKGDDVKTKKLQEMMSTGDLLTEVAAPPEPKGPTASSSGKRKKEEQPVPERNPEERERLRRRAMSRRICLGQLVWDCSQQPPRAAKVTAIAAERSEPFLIRHLDAPKGPSNTSFKVGDPVMVNDRSGTCFWDGRPEHEYGRVKWEDGSLSEILPISQITAESRIEEIFVGEDDLAPLDLSHLLKMSQTVKQEPGTEAARPRVAPPLELVLRNIEARSQLKVGQVAWCLQPQRPPWPVKLISVEGNDAPASSRIWRVRYLESEIEEKVAATRLTRLLPGDSVALEKVAKVAEQELRKADAFSAAKAARAADEAKLMQVKEESAAANPVALNSGACSA